MGKEKDLAKPNEDAPVEQSDDAGSAKWVKVTTYIREDQAFPLELIQNDERARRGRDFDQAELYQEALDMLIKTRIIAIRLPPNRIAKKSG